jgi:hypothetical protein
LFLKMAVLGFYARICSSARLWAYLWTNVRSKNEGLREIASPWRWAIRRCRAPWIPPAFTTSPSLPATILHRSRLPPPTAIPLGSPPKSILSPSTLSSKKPFDASRPANLSW